LDNTAWYNYIAKILEGSKEVAKKVILGKHCLVHCSDGWDRTS